MDSKEASVTPRGVSRESDIETGDFKSEHMADGDSQSQRRADDIKCQTGAADKLITDDIPSEIKAKGVTEGRNDNSKKRDDEENLSECKPIDVTDVNDVMHINDDDNMSFSHVSNMDVDDELGDLESSRHVPSRLSVELDEAAVDR